MCHLNHGNKYKKEANEPKKGKNFLGGERHLGAAGAISAGARAAPCSGGGAGVAEGTGGMPRGA